MATEGSPGNDRGRELRDRAFEFGARILDLAPRLAADGERAAHMALQLSRAATSLGAQLEEGAAPHSRRDMAWKHGLALREARESHFWLRLFSRNKKWTAELRGDVLESAELVAMLKGSVRKLRRPPSDRS
jgi:four helix bundle protein